MKKLISILLLSGSLVLSGCGDSSSDYTQVSGQQGNPGPVVPTPTPTPTATAGYFVDAANGNDATAAAAVNPTSDTPFKTIQAAVTDAPNGTDITVRVGTYTEIVTLKNGQRLLGTAGGNRPVVSGRIILADGNTVDFIQIQDAPDDAIDGDNRNGGTITNCVITDATNNGRGVSVVPGSGTWIITSNTITDVEGLGVHIATDGTGNLRAQVNDNQITGSSFDAIGFLAEDDSQLVGQAHGNTMTGNQVGATFEAIAGNNAVLSLDIEDNTNDDVYRFGSIDTSTINVEQFAQLETINDSGTVSVSGVSNPIFDVADGFCGF